MSRNAGFGRGLVLAGGVGMLCVTTAMAQTAQVTATPPATVSTNAQDYSQGFRAFIRMGLPDTSKAKYVKLDSPANGMSSVMYRMYEIQLSGNAWLVSENKDDKSVLVSSSGRTLQLADQKTVMKKQEAEARSNAVAKVEAAGEVSRAALRRMSQRGSEWAETGNWTPVDLSRDLVKATAFVDKKLKAKAAGGREMRYDSFLQSDEPAGVLFLLAAFAWQNGKTQEANALAGRLFTLLGDSRKVIVGALNVMADADLAATADAFAKTRDWKAYHADVSAVLKKYPAGWRNAGAAKLLSDRLQARSAMAQPPALTGDGLGDEEQKLAAALASETNHAAMNFGGGDLWILPPAQVMRVTKDETAIGCIKARGIKSIPLLIAMVADETLCPLRRNEVGLPTVVSSSSDDAEKPEAERVQQLYNQMDRPVTRGEIARALLAPLCKRDANARPGEPEATPEEVVDGAKQAYATLKNLPPSTLATHFLKNGDQNQKQSVVNYMLQNDVDTNAPVIEAFLLTPPEDEEGSMMMQMGSGLAQQYVMKRGEKAAEFVEKYAAMRKKAELPAGMADNVEYVKIMEKQANREIVTLRALVKKQDLSETVADLAKSGDAGESAMAAYTALGRQPPAKAAPALLAAAVKATNLAVRVRLVQMMPMLRYAGMQESMQEEMSEAGGETDPESAMKKFAEKNKLNIGTNAAEWRILLADTRVIPGGGMYSGGSYAWTVADMAAMGIETLYGDATLAQRYGRGGGAENLRPDVMMRVYRDRAVARLDGKPEDQLPKMPSADDVTAERRQAIEASVVKTAPEAMGAILDKLTEAEGMYLAEAASEKDAVMMALAPMSRRIVSVKPAPALAAEEAARLQKLAGTEISTNAIAEMREVCKRQLAAGAAFVVTLSSGGVGRGLRLDVTPVDAGTQRMYGSGYASMLGSMGSRKGMVMGSLRSAENGAQGMWLIDLPAPVAPTGAVSVASAADDDSSEDRFSTMQNMFESQQEQFETAVATLCKPDESIGPATTVSFTGFLPSKEKDKKKDSDDEDEEDAEAMPGMMIE